MDEEKKYIGKWWIWILFLLIISIIVVSILNYVGLIGKTFVERKVFEQSYQKSEADKTAKTAYSAQIALLRGKLNNTNLDSGTKAEIKAQLDALMILKAGKED